jgi:hypothetical protein
MLSVNNFGDDGAIEMARLIDDSPALQEISLASNGIGLRGGKSVFEAIARHPSIRYFDFGYSPSTKALGARGNYLGELGVLLVTMLLKRNALLQKLNLRKTGVDELGVEAIGDAIVGNSNLVSLTLDRKLPLRIAKQLANNKANSPELQVPREIEMIRSVYRSAK